MRRVILIHRGSSYVEVIAAYDPVWLDVLKDATPSTGRFYSKDTKTWRVKAAHEHALREAANGYFDEVEDLWDSEVPDNMKVSVSWSAHTTNQCLAEVRRVYPDEAALGLLPGAPTSLVQAAYRVAALENHPDRGGAHEKMVAVNRAYDRLLARTAS